MSDLQPAWEDLLASTIVGTDRRPLHRAVTDCLLPAGRAARGPEREVLDAAAAFGLYRRAGRETGSAPVNPTPVCAPDPSLSCSARAADHLEQLLAEKDDDLLTEWLHAAAAAGLRAPHRLLPALLDRGKELLRYTEQQLKASVPIDDFARVAGPRGRWLAGSNADWTYFRERDVDELWQTGTRDERHQLLAGLVRRNPGRALALLARTGAHERIEDRVRFLRALATNPVKVAEPALEAALDDRAEDVRLAAAAALARLPDSDLCERIFTRLQRLLTFEWRFSQESSLPGGARIVARLPQEDDPALQRDGIVAAVARGPAGLRAAMLVMMIEKVPPRRWCALWSASPVQILAAMDGSQWTSIMKGALRQAAINFSDGDWLEAFATDTPADAALLWLVDQQRGQRRLLDALRALPADEPPLHDLMDALTHARRPFDTHLSQAVLDAMRSIARAQPRPAVGWATWRAARLACSIDPALADEATRGWPEAELHWPDWQPIVERFLRRLAFRRDMLAALGLVDSGQWTEGE